MAKVAAFCCGVLALASGANATAVVVTDTITGSAGNWVHNFTAYNNIGGTNDLYYFGVDMYQDNEIARPTGWRDNGSYTPASIGGSGTIYRDTFFTSPTADPATAAYILPGASLGGFKVAEGGPTASTNLHFVAFAYNGTYNGADSFRPGTNPAFEGLVTPAGAVPEPASWAMILSGFGMFGSVLRRQRAAASVRSF